jgi:hypothetical protein
VRGRASHCSARRRTADDMAAGRASGAPGRTPFARTCELRARVRAVTARGARVTWACACARAERCRATRCCAVGPPRTRVRYARHRHVPHDARGWRDPRHARTLRGRCVRRGRRSRGVGPRGDRARDLRVARPRATRAAAQRAAAAGTLHTRAPAAPTRAGLAPHSPAPFSLLLRPRSPPTISLSRS